MNRRILGLGLALICACPGLVGCELLHQSERKHADDRFVEEEETPAIGEVKSEAPKGFFKSSRLPGAMSSEARDIERDLGIQ
jgi:hypothetical protein